MQLDDDDWPFRRTQAQARHDARCGYRPDYDLYDRNGDEQQVRYYEAYEDERARIARERDEEREAEERWRRAQEEREMEEREREEER